MITLAIQALRGANFWSPLFPKLIQVRLELAGNDKFSNEKLERLQQQMLGYWPDNFSVDGLDVEEKMVAMLANIALGLQNAAGCKLHFYEFRKTKFSGIYNLVFAYEYEQAGKQAAKSAIKVWQLLQENKDLGLSVEVARIRDIIAKEQPVAPLQHLITEAKEAGIPIIHADEDMPMQFGYGKKGIDVTNTNPPHSIHGVFQHKENGRIPIIAITGSNGKTTTTRLIAHLLKVNGQKVGFTTSDGIYIDEQMIDEGDTTGPMSAETVLRNKEVEVAVLETARGGIVRAGLGFDICDMAVVTNVQDDHLGISDIETLEDLARVKNVVVAAVKPEGYAILNADNEYTVEMGRKAKCKVAWFALNVNNPVLVNALQKGEPIAYVANNEILLQHNQLTIKVAHLKNVPLTFEGSLGFMVQNTLAAVLAAHLFGLATEVIALGLKSFLPSSEQTPGRMNIFKCGDCKLLVDFAHNPDGFTGIRDYMQTVESTYKIGIIVGTGDRKEEDVRMLGRLSAQMFDHILIHQVKFLRGKTSEALVSLLVEGILSQNPDAKWERVPDATEPLGYALSLATKGAYIVALSDVLNNPAQLIKDYQASAVNKA